jgi:hypothetical protein
MCTSNRNAQTLLNVSRCSCWSQALGRSYRYHSGAAPLFAFGDGTSFSDHSLAVAPPPSQCELAFGVRVATTAGPKAGDVVVLAFLAPVRPGAFKRP